MEAHLPLLLFTLILLINVTEGAPKAKKAKENSSASPAKSSTKSPSIVKSVKTEKTNVSVEIKSTAIRSVPSSKMEEKEKTCPPSFTIVNGRCLFFSGNETRSWGNALEFCRKKDGTLASVYSKDQNDDIVTYIKKNGGGKSHWLGGMLLQKTQSWQWEASGQTFNFTDWVSADDSSMSIRSTDKCLYVSKEDGFKWNGSACDEEHPFICQLLSLQEALVQSGNPHTALEPVPMYPPNSGSRYSGRHGKWYGSSYSGRQGGGYGAGSSSGYGSWYGSGYGSGYGSRHGSGRGGAHGGGTSSRYRMQFPSKQKLEDWKRLESEKWVRRYGNKGYPGQKYAKVFHLPHRYTPKPWKRGNTYAVDSQNGASSRIGGVYRGPELIRLRKHSKANAGFAVQSPTRFVSGNFHPHGDIRIPILQRQRSSTPNTYPHPDHRPSHWDRTRGKRLSYPNGRAYSPSRYENTMARDEGARNRPVGRSLKNRLEYLAVPQPVYRHGTAQQMPRPYSYKDRYSRDNKVRGTFVGHDNRRLGFGERHKNVLRPVGSTAVEQSSVPLSAGKVYNNIM